MAQKVLVRLIDDIDGSDAAETVPFSLDGVHYEIDLSEENAAELREMFSAWVTNARRVGGSKRKSSSSGSSKKKGDVDLAEVRAWAQENGYEVSDRGRIAASVMTAYEEAH